jgi:hypothetical protein
MFQKPALQDPGKSDLLAQPAQYSTGTDLGLGFLLTSVGPFDFINERVLIPDFEI